MTTVTTQTLLLLASSQWTAPGKRSAAEQEKQALRLSNHLLRQQQQGRKTTVVWYVNEGQLAEQLQQQLQQAGCPDCVTFVVISQSPSDIFNNEGEWIEDWHDDLRSKIETDINHRHANALELWPPNSLEDLPVWYYCVMADIDASAQPELDAICDHYADLLPNHHRPKAQAWLAMLLEEAGEEALESSWLGYNDFVLKAIALAKLLHDFDEACDNGFSDLSYGDAVQVGISPLFLGSKLTEDDLLELEAYVYPNEDDLCSAALELYIDREYRELIGLPAPFSGADDLFYTLWSSTWPDYQESVDRRVEQLLGENLVTEKMRAFEFLQGSSVCT